MTKIGPVDFEIIGLTEVVTNKDETEAERRPTVLFAVPAAAQQPRALNKDACIAYSVCCYGPSWWQFLTGRSALDWIASIVGTSAYSARPVLVLRPLSFGSCTVYVISIATDDVTERVVYIRRLCYRLGSAMENEPLEKKTSVF